MAYRGQLDECLQQQRVPEWMTRERTALIIKDKEAGPVAVPTNNLPLIDVETPHVGNERRTLQTSGNKKFVTRGTKRLSEKFQGNQRSIANRQDDHKKMQEKANRTRDGLDRL